MRETSIKEILYISELGNGESLIQFLLENHS